MIDLYVNGVEGVYLIPPWILQDTDNFKTCKLFHRFIHAHTVYTTDSLFCEGRPTVDITPFCPWTRRDAEDSLSSSIIRTCTVMRNDDRPPYWGTTATCSWWLAEGLRHVGHKGLYFLYTWEGVDWKGSTCDKIYDYKLFCEWGLNWKTGFCWKYKNWCKQERTRKHWWWETFSDFGENHSRNLP